MVGIRYKPRIKDSEGYNDGDFSNENNNDYACSDEGFGNKSNNDYTCSDQFSDKGFMMKDVHLVKLVMTFFSL